LQFPTVVKPAGDGSGLAQSNPAYPDGVPTPSQLANSTLETYIQGFHYGQKTTNANSIPTTDQMQNIVPVPSNPVDPFQLNTYNKSGGAERVTSSCVGCHSDAAMTTGSSSDRVFSLDRAKSSATLRRQIISGSMSTSSGKAPDSKTLETVRKYLGAGGSKSGP
jgi:hypothetical protein